MKQRSMNEYIESPLRGYKIASSEWIGKTGKISPVSTKMKTRSNNSRSKKIKSPSRKAEVLSPLGKWIQHTRYESQDEDENTKITSEPGTKPSNKTESSIKCNVIDDDEVDSINLEKKERRIRDNYDQLKENNSTKNEKSVSNKISPSSSNSKARSKRNTKNSLSQKPIKEVVSPLQKWMQRKKYNQLQNEDKDRQSTSKNTKMPFRKSNSFDKYGIILPTVDDILKNMNTMKEEGRMLDDYDDQFEESDISIPGSLKDILDSPEKSSTIPLLTCEHLTEVELKAYSLKYLDYLKDISHGVEFSQRHQTYNNPNSRSSLTYSSYIMVFTEPQLGHLMKEIEKTLDPEEKRADYLFMVILPELCLKICMDEFDMSKEETIHYLNRRLVY